MKIEQRLWKEDGGWESIPTELVDRNSADLVLAFGARTELSNGARFNELKAFYPNATIVTCSTAGEIIDGRVLDDTIVATAIAFDATRHRSACIRVASIEESRKAGETLIAELLEDDLRHVLVFSDGQCVNGTQLVTGLTTALPNHIQVTGGLAGDAARFQLTLVGLDFAPLPRQVVAIGLYGDAIRVGSGSRGGWDSFGQDRVITKSKDNVLYELDGHSALDLYKQYLGEMAAVLPGAALLFPLSVKVNNYDPVVRTILSIDEEAKSMTFAGDMPQGALARLMKANFDRLVDAAYVAAESSMEKIGASEPELAILISCVGRKLVLDDRIEEEVETVREVVGKRANICGFYSYGEISPFTPNARCELHNQTMTITTLREELVKA